MEKTVIPLIVVAVVAAIGLAVTAVVRDRRRREALHGLVERHGWSLENRRDDLTHRWDGPPFRGHPRKSKARDVVSGHYRGRPFTAFTYAYTTSTSTGQTTSTSTHRYCVWIVDLDTALPSISLGAEGVLGGRVARAFGLGGVEIGRPAFDRRYKVACDDPEYAVRLLKPPLIDQMTHGAVWAWRLDAASMISYTKGRLGPEELVARLDQMADVLDRIPDEIWRTYGR